MKITKPFPGLGPGEQKRLTEIRFLAQVDLAMAKIVAADWVLSNNQRRIASSRVPHRQVFAFVVSD